MNYYLNDLPHFYNIISVYLQIMTWITVKISYSWSERFPESTSGEVWFAFCSASCWFRKSSLLSIWKAFDKLKNVRYKISQEPWLGLIWISNLCKTDRIFFKTNKIDSLPWWHKVIDERAPLIHHCMWNWRTEKCWTEISI